eukprot:scaffold4425_cov153-Skeletonema_marinoi.AAC.5
MTTKSSKRKAAASKVEDEEDIGALIYRESQLRKKEAAAAAAVKKIERNSSSLTATRTVSITSPPTSKPTTNPFEKQDSGLTFREEQWLDGHNVRREKWHEQYGKKYKPLKWSEELKDMAQSYADELASDCGATVHDSYENRKGYGENLASNTGFGSWGELKSVDKIMTRYVERESTWVPPANNHLCY